MLSIHRIAVAAALGILFIARAALADNETPKGAQSSALLSSVSSAHESDITFSNYKFQDGEVLSQLHLHYATVGQPHRNQRGDIDNAILLLHWTSASAQALLTPEYKQALFASGAPFDARRYFVILPDAVGHGRSSKPSDGLRTAFPHYGYSDMVDLQHKLLVETLGITHLRAVVGMSMGCMNAWQWAEKYPDAMDGIMPVACFPTAITGRNLLWRRMVIGGIKADPAWADGAYRQQPPALLSGLEILRLMIDGVPHLQAAVDSRETADSFISQVRQQAAALDANDLIYSLESSSDFDARTDLSRIKAKVFALNFADDEFYRDSLQTLQQEMPQLKNGRLIVHTVSDGSVGHLSMAHPTLWSDAARAFITWLGPT